MNIGGTTMFKAYVQGLFFSENIPTYGQNYRIRLRTSILGPVFIPMD